MDESRVSRRRLWAISTLTLVVAAAGAGLYASRRDSRVAEVLTKDDLDLRLGTCAVADVEVILNEVGTIEPIVKVDVKSSLSGRVTDLLVRAGDRVRRGQVLARVEPDVNQAQTLSAVRSDLRLAEIRARDAERDLEAQTRLHRERYISDQQLREYEVRRDTASEALEAARTRMRIVEESGIPMSGTISTSQHVNLVSPMEGTVIKKNVEVGQTVTSGMSSFNEGTVIYTVADLRSMLIKAAINEVDIGKIAVGMPVTVTVDAFPYRRYDGVVSYIAPAARLNDKVKVFDVEVSPRDQVPDFRAGMTANIEVHGDRVEDTLSVPLEAVARRETGTVVYVLRRGFAAPGSGETRPRRLASGRYDISPCWPRFFEERPVEIGLVGLERAQILKGLQAGEEVALEIPSRPRSFEEED